MKNYTLEELTNFKNKQWYTTESQIVNLYDEVNLQNFGKLKINGLHESIETLETTYHSKIEYNKLIVNKHVDFSIIHYKYYIKHYNENYLTLVTTEIKLDLEPKAEEFLKEIEKILKNKAWSYYTELLMNEEIIPKYIKPMLRTDFEEFVADWKEIGSQDIWNSKGIEDNIMQYEPELKFIQDEWEEEIENERLFNESLVTAYVDFYESNCITQEMSVIEFKKFYKSVRNRINENMTMLFDEELKNMRYCTGLRLYKKVNSDLIKVKIKDYL
jgi:hypothetical protein